MTKLETDNLEIQNVMKQIATDEVTIVYGFFGL
jgi:hypothetical protein